MRTEKITYEDQYQGHPIMTDKARQLGCKESILQKIDQLMTDMSNRHSKVFFMRYDVRFPQDYDYPNDNELFSQFQESTNSSASFRRASSRTVNVRDMIPHTLQSGSVAGRNISTITLL